MFGSRDRRIHAPAHQRLPINPRKCVVGAATTGTTVVDNSTPRMSRLTHWFGLLLLLGNSRWWRLLLAVVVGVVGSRDIYMRPHPKLYLSTPRDASQAPIHASGHRVHCGCATPRAWFCLLLLSGMVAVMCNRQLVVPVARSIRYLCASAVVTALLANHGHFASHTVSQSSGVIGASSKSPVCFFVVFACTVYLSIPRASALFFLDQ